jgi:peptide/nickel transport system permease protein
MAGFIIKRLMQSVLLIFLVLTITFFLLHLAPGDPMAKYYNRQGVSPETVKMMRIKFGLDRPITEQYIKWVANFARGDFGVSLHYNRRPVRSLILEAIPNTLRLTVVALLLYIVIGISLGILSAVKKDTLFDKVNTVTALFLYSIPSFWLSLMLIFIFSLKLGILPSSHMQSIGMEGAGWFELLCDRARHIALPAFVLGVASAAGIARYMRGSMLDVLREDYIRTARAKGLENKKIFLKHAQNPY